MPTVKLTKRLIDELKPEAKDVFHWDAEIKGLGVKVTPTGKKVFLVQYRPGGRGTPTRKVTLGEHGVVTLHKARLEASRILVQRADGRDPAIERQNAKRRLATDRFEDIANEFLEKHATQTRSCAETKRILGHDVIPEWGKRSIHEIGKRQISDLLDQVVGRGSPIMANRILAAIRKLFNWAVSRGIIASSPCQGISAPQRETARHRVLNDDELIAVLKAANQMGGAFGGIVKMLFLTAQRLREVSNMRWDEIDFDQGIWTIPSARTKNGKPHFVHLSAQAKTALLSIPKIGDYVFTTNGKTPFSGFSKSKTRIDVLSGVTDWRLHDIRRTVTSGMAELGIVPHVADKVLNHQSGTISGVAAVYQRHEYIEERKFALETWGRHIEALVNGIDRQNVISIRAARQP